MSRFQRRMLTVPVVVSVFADAQSGALVFAGVVPFEQLGATPIPVSHGRTLPLARGLRDLPSMRRYAPRGSFVSIVTADAATGVLILSGSSSESKAGSDSPTGTLIFGGSRVESIVFSASPSGTLIFGGSASESNTTSNPVQFEVDPFAAVFHAGYFSA